MTVDGWDQPRWAAILERIEHREAGIGLRFCGPPLWLEVTMSGPDSDAWSTADAGETPDRSWDWQSSNPCVEAMRLAADGADDDRLLGSASRYTLENLILNSVHEIGEWLRFDARRLFPAHGGHTQRPDGSTYAIGDGAQGNGVVSVDFSYDETFTPSSDAGIRGATTQRRMSERAAEAVASWRFTYLPGTAISYGPQGPIIVDTSGRRDRHDGDRRLTWSAAALTFVAAPDAEFVEAVKRDVHRAVIIREAGRVCGAFHVDRRQAWRLEMDTVGPPMDNGDGRPVSVTVSYASPPTYDTAATAPQPAGASAAGHES
jgi:hypothetical protein